MCVAVLNEVNTKMNLASAPLPLQQTQRGWAAKSVGERLAVLRKARHLLTEKTSELAGAISSELHRTPADTRVAEVLPLLAACRFLEQSAGTVLAPRRLGRRGLPFWLAGVSSEIRRVALGHVLVIGPANYPLFLPGGQTLQALAAGNSVTWKPGLGGRAVAEVFASALRDAGLPNGLLQITDETVEAARKGLATKPDKVFFTGSAETGRLLMRQLAESLTPSVMELSGCDAVIVLSSADIERVVKALTFGMRLNGSATCMAPRRVILVDLPASLCEMFVSRLRDALKKVKPVTLPISVSSQLTALLTKAEQAGATIHGNFSTQSPQPIVVTEVRPDMMIAQADLFAPVLSLMNVANEEDLLAAQEACPFALTAAIFGEEAEARRLAGSITAGTVLINDIIVPTADPRVPFGGRRQSGFGVTRGAEGLLEMTAVQTVLGRRGKSTRHFEETTVMHEELFDGVIEASHAGSWIKRWQGMKKIVTAGRKLKGNR